MLRIRTTTYVLFGILIAALIAAVLITVFRPLEAKSGENKGGVPHPTPTVSVLDTPASSTSPTISTQPTGTPTALRGRRYTNKVGGYSLIVPDGWRVDGSGPYTVFIVRQTQQREGEPPSFRVQATLGGNDVLAANLAKGGTSPDACIELRHSVQLDGFPAERWACGDSEVRRMYVTVQRDNAFYWLGGAIWVKDWERDFPIFEGILTSIKFIPIETPPPEQPSPVSR